jgi:charged multivesicular body protein 4
MNYFTGRRDTKASARDAIVTLRQQLAMLEKKEQHLQTKIDAEVRTARANAVSNKTGEWDPHRRWRATCRNAHSRLGGYIVATAALRRKKANENQLDQLSGQRLQLEMQVNTIESANLNAETMQAMKKGSDALKAIHGNMSVLSILVLWVLV